MTPPTAMATHCRERGVSLIEVITVLVIFSILALMAAPGFVDYIANSRLRESGNVVLSQALLARGEAIKRNTRVRLTTSGNQVEIADIRDAANPVVITTVTLAEAVTASATTIRFNGEGRSIDAGGSMTGASVDFSITTASCSGEIRCPGLRVDGGGSVRLCGDRLNCI
jgi:type IV fimbrial biogenesis protein FimT